MKDYLTIDELNAKMNNKKKPVKNDGKFGMIGDFFRNAGETSLLGQPSSSTKSQSHKSGKKKSNMDGIYDFFHNAGKRRMI